MELKTLEWFLLTALLTRYRFLTNRGKDKIEVLN